MPVVLDEVVREVAAVQVKLVLGVVVLDEAVLEVAAVLVSWCSKSKWCL